LQYDLLALQYTEGGVGSAICLGQLGGEASFAVHQIHTRQQLILIKLEDLRFLEATRKADLWLLFAICLVVIGFGITVVNN